MNLARCFNFPLYASLMMLQSTYLMRKIQLYPIMDKQCKLVQGWREFDSKFLLIKSLVILHAPINL